MPTQLNVNELKDAFDQSGAMLQKLEDKRTAMIMDLKDDPEKYTNEELKKISDSIKDAKQIRDMAEEAYADARAEQVAAMKEEDKKPLDKSEKSIKDKFVNDFKGMLKGDPKIINAVTSDRDEKGNAIGLTIPEDVQTAIHQLVRQYDALEQYVNVESVSLPSGSRVYEKWSDITPLANLDDETAKIGDNDDPKLTLIKYTVKRYAGITTATNSLLNDTAENILQWLTGWIAKKVVVTRNQAIIATINTFTKKPTIAKWDDIKDLTNSVDPAIKPTSIFLTNSSGFTALSKVKDAMGRYLMQPDVTNPEISKIGQYKVVEISDRWLPDNAGTHPLYFGDLKQAVTLFDRENMSLLSTNIGGGAFETDTTKVRVIDRFDVEATDTEAFVPGGFKTIADQTANLGGSASASTGK